MACSQLLTFFILTILLFIFISPSLSFPDNAADANAKAPSPVESQKVNLSLYYESLCPFCANFIENQLGKVLDTDLITIVNLRLVPYGNAVTTGPKETITCQATFPFSLFTRSGTKWYNFSSYGFTNLIFYILLQHGENECYLNTIHACAIKAWPDFKKHFKLIQCIEGQASASISVIPLSEQPEAAWRKCCDSLGFSQEPIDSCYKSGEGRQLVLKYGSETDGLKPPHRFVPWVTVNFKPLAEDYPHFISYVCNEYKGKLPNACKSRWIGATTVKETSVLPNPVCYQGEATETQSSLFAAAGTPETEPPA